MTPIQLYEFLEGKNFFEELKKYTDKEADFLLRRSFFKFSVEKKPEYQIGLCKVSIEFDVENNTIWTDRKSKERLHWGHYKICLTTVEESTFIVKIDNMEMEDDYKDLDIMKLIIFESNLQNKSNSGDLKKTKI